MLHTATPQNQSPFRALIEWYRRQRMVNELAGLDPGEAGRLADDLKVSVDDLVVAAGQSEDEMALMNRMMALHGIDRAKVEADMPAVIREMTVTCARCGHKGECQYDLDHGGTAEDADAYCLNAGTMQALSTPQA
ncbi:MAG: DUF6455 family protein [Beijerinckiaceae bacterium]